MSSIHPEYWRRLETLFHAAVNLNTQLRDEYLAEACADDPDLRRQVISLIVSSTQSENILEDVISSEAALVAGLAPGRRIGQYEIVREIGEGGMGTVYLAIRADDEFRKQVAIKLMRADLIHRSSMHRFRQERQILATLEHPGIARLLDGGALSTGAPYVVMEYVEGVPVDLYCRQRGLSVHDRLTIFLKIAEAVSYAHRNLVIHRDIKPDNVLVTAQGEPKLLDFGIAKLVKSGEESADSGQTAYQTIAAERLMTPEYASPEQARGEPITTQSDVYSLGALLYALLTDRAPFQFASSRATDIEREICETVPARASLAAHSLPEWKRLGRNERHDLDTILTVALHKEPARRYASVENFAADIRRFLDGFPVEARGDSWSYRTGKLMRRHPLAASAAALFLLVILGFSIAMGVLAKRAREEARISNEVTDFLISVFRANDPSNGRGDKVTARELLDRGADQLKSRLADSPQVQAQLFDTMGALYSALGAPQKAEELLKRSIEVRRTRLTLNDDAAAETYDNLGDLASDMSRYSDSERYYREALAIHVKRDGANSAAVANDESQIASTLWNLGRIFEAEGIDREAIALQVKLAGEDDLTALDMENDLGTVLLTEGRYQDAAQMQKSILDRRLRLERPNHPDLGYSWHNYAQALFYLGELSQAEAAEREALAVRIAAYGEGHPQVALTEGELAKVLVKAGKPDEALSLARQSFATEMKTYGQQNRDTTYTQANLARALLATGDGAEALKTAREMVAARRELFPAGHPKIADGMELLGSIEFALGDLKAAAADFKSAVASRSSFFGPRHVLVADGEILFAEVQAHGGQLAEAERTASDALAIERSVFPDGHPQVGLAESALGGVKLSEGQAKTALDLLKDAYKQLSKAFGPANPQTASVGLRLARALAANGDSKGALQLAQAQIPTLGSSKDPQWAADRALAERVRRKGVSALL